MNPFDSSLFTAPTCLPCCTPAPTACSCALLIPPLLSPYADYATADTAITDHVTDCLMFSEAADGSGAILATATIAITTTVDIELADTSVNRGQAYISVAMLASDTVSIAASVTANGTNPARPAFVSATFYGCDGTELDTGSTTGSETAASDTFVFTAPADGEYIIYISGGGAGDATQFDLTDTLTFSGAFVVNPVIALWDDSGTTRSLWACPKLLLPPLTESTGTWYADATAAATAITDLTASCKGYIESLTNVATFTASGTTSLTLSNTLTAAAMTSPRMWGGVNAVNAATITVTGSVGAGTVTINVGIYDDTGTLVETSGAVASPWTSAGLPYKGRYTIGVLVSSSSNTTSMSGVITSSGTMSVNPPQARYDVGLVCAATDDC